MNSIHMRKSRVMQEEQVSFPMTAQADLKALTEHMMFLMLQIASRRKRQQGRERETDRKRWGDLLFYFSLPTNGRTLEHSLTMFSLPPR